MVSVGEMVKFRHTVFDTEEKLNTLKKWMPSKLFKVDDKLCNTLTNFWKWFKIKNLGDVYFTDVDKPRCSMLLLKRWAKIILISIV